MSPSLPSTRPTWGVTDTNEPTPPQSFTGAEIAALLTEGCIIGSDEVFSDELESQAGAMPFMQRLTSGYQHWIRGVYLITAVQPDDGTAARPPPAARHSTPLPFAACVRRFVPGTTGGLQSR